MLSVRSLKIIQIIFHVLDLLFVLCQVFFKALIFLGERLIVSWLRWKRCSGRCLTRWLHGCCRGFWAQRWLVKTAPAHLLIVVNVLLQAYINKWIIVIRFGVRTYFRHGAFGARFLARGCDFTILGRWLSSRWSVANAFLSQERAQARRTYSVQTRSERSGCPNLVGAQRCASSARSSRSRSAISLFGAPSCLPPSCSQCLWMSTAPRRTRLSPSRAVSENFGHFLAT